MLQSSARIFNSTGRIFWQNSAAIQFFLGTERVKFFSVGVPFDISRGTKYTEKNNYAANAKSTYQYGNICRGEHIKPLIFTFTMYRYVNCKEVISTLVYLCICLFYIRITYFLISGTTLVKDNILVCKMNSHSQTQKSELISLLQYSPCKCICKNYLSF